MGGAASCSKSIAPNVLYAVCDEQSAAGRVALPLEDCFDCPEWRYLVQRCKHKLFLTASTFQEFNTLPRARVLSYRWKEVVTVECSVRAPGMKPSEPRSCTFCADAFDALKDFSGGYLWVDYLCHLNDAKHKIHVMEQMGSLYWGGEVLPTYLIDVDMQEENGSEGGCIDGKNFRYLTVKKQSSSSLVALRRGWIQQEIGFGRLDASVVEGFVLRCVRLQYFGVLGTLIRRRPRAMAWMFTGADDKAKSMMFLDTTAEDMRQGTNGILGKSRDSSGVSVEVQNAVRNRVSDQLLQAAPTLHRKIVSAGKQRRDEVTKQLHALYAKEEAANKTSYFSPSDELYRIAGDVWDLDQKRLFDFDSCGSDVRDEIISALRPFLTDLVSKLCEPVAFDPADFFCAFQLVRSFAESELTVESDASVALTQVEAVSAGMKWRATVGGELGGTSLELLRACWRTVFRHVTEHKLFVEMRIVRKEDKFRTLGLFRFLKFFQSIKEKDPNHCGRYKVLHCRCGKLMMQVKYDRFSVGYTLEKKPEGNPDNFITVKGIKALFG